MQSQRSERDCIRLKETRVERTELLHQGRTLVPRLQDLIRPRDEVLARHGADGDVSYLGGLEARLGQERLKLFPDRFEPGLSPADLRVQTESRNLSHQLGGSVVRARASLARTASSLLTATTSCCTPRLRTSTACSRVCPPPSNPFSKPPLDPSTTRIAVSACAAPEIMLGIKSRWPGASMRVKRRCGVANESIATSIVTPLGGITRRQQVSRQSFHSIAPPKQSKRFNVPFAFLVHRIECPGIGKAPLAHLVTLPLVVEDLLVRSFAEVVQDPSHQGRLACVDMTC